MSPPIPGFPPVAKLCSNCQKAQFRDDVPELFQDGSSLEFDRLQVLRYRRNRSWGMIPTEFEWVDEFPELPRLVKSFRDGCDFCSFLHKAITFATSGRAKISTSTHARVILVTISYVWGPAREEDISSGGSVWSEESISSNEHFLEWPIGLNAMRIHLELSSDPDDVDSECLFTLDCAIQDLRGEYSSGLSQHACMHLTTCIC